MFERQQQIPKAEEMVGDLPLPGSLKPIKSQRDKLIKDVLSGNSGKLLVIVGPCSAHAPAPVLEYVEKLGKLSLKLGEKLVLVPRIYTNKPRTRGVGYKGMFFQPDLAQPENILKGVAAIRKLNISAIEVSGLTAADELLYPEYVNYTADLLSYFTVGARSCENQFHRLVASGMEAPVGVKNPTSGSVSALVNSVYAAQREQVFMLDGWQVKTTGNQFAHAILRGASDMFGNDIPNYHYEEVMRAAALYLSAGLANPAIIIDANHSNSGKNYSRQAGICAEVMHNRNRDCGFKKIVKGLMIESFLEEGSQTENKVYGKSVTDPCLGWAETERLLYDIADSV